MNYKSYSDEGIVINRRKFGEADRILTIFSKEHGKIAVIAKGVRKLTSRKRGNIEIFNRIKFAASRTLGMDILTEVEVLDSQHVIRNDMKKISVAFYFCEVVNKSIRDDEKNNEVYEILGNALRDLENCKNFKKLRLEFVEELLVALGFWPKDRPLRNADETLENILERKINSFTVGRKMLRQG